MQSKVRYLHGYVKSAVVRNQSRIATSQMRLAFAVAVGLATK